MTGEKKMNFYRSFYDLTTLLPERERQKVNTAMLDYFFEGIEPTGLSKNGMKVFLGCKGRISKSRTNASNVNARYEDQEDVEDDTDEPTNWHTTPPTNCPTKHATNGHTNRPTNVSTKFDTKPSPEREGEGEIERDKDKNSPIPYDEIVGYLNEKIGAMYRPTSKKTRSLIHARWAEGFREPQFKAVIDTMYAAWGNDPKMSCYLRPETLFGTKFESYLNRPIASTRVQKGGVTGAQDKYSKL